MRSFAPAQRRVYSNVGIELAGELVERATGMAFADYLGEAVSAPLGMRDTSLPGSPARDGVSSVADLARVVSELLTPSGLLGAPTLADLATVQYPGLRGVLPGFGGQDPNDWGLGFEIRGHKSPHWTGSANSARDVRALRPVGHLPLARPGRRARPGRARRPRLRRLGPDRLARAVRRRPHRAPR